ncbi:MAG: hypothetical protein IPM59_03565 [Chloracidobacterium sp.]|nr:hypothetical protein [Chloracidobacterium sp.]
MEKLADAYMDGVFDREIYAIKKNSLINEKADIVSELNELDQDTEQITLKLRNFLELAKSAYLSYESADDEKKRDLIKTVTSNLVATDKKLIVKLNSPFDLVADRPNGPNGCPFRDAPRTFSALLSQLFKYFTGNRSVWSQTEVRGGSKNAELIAK